VISTLYNPRLSGGRIFRIRAPKEPSIVSINSSTSAYSEGKCFGESFCSSISNSKSAHAFWAAELSASFFDEQFSSPVYQRPLTSTST